MTILQAAILGIVQGLTEFIPVSSSGHLLIAHHALGIKETGLAFDVALHFGTLLALLAFFNKELVDLFVALWRKSTQTRLAWLLVLATIPAAVAGWLLESAAESTFRSLRLVSLTLMGFAVLMLLAERFARRVGRPTSLEGISKRQVLVMGAAQAAAVIPGVSRSGSTITAGLFMGLDRVAATRFSFLLAIPITAGAILKVFTEPSAMHQLRNEQAVFAVGVVTALVSGLFAIRFLLRFVAKHSLHTFAYYRLALGLLVLLITLR